METSVSSHTLSPQSTVTAHLHQAMYPNTSRKTKPLAHLATPTSVLHWIITPSSRVSVPPPASSSVSDKSGGVANMSCRHKYPLWSLTVRPRLTLTPLACHSCSHKSSWLNSRTPWTFIHQRALIYKWKLFLNTSKKLGIKKKH